jgi:AbrB family looped-hinge helix DNA binding protein
METVLVSQKFQIVIPRAIRQPMGIEPGQRLQAFRYGDRVELVPRRERAYCAWLPTVPARLGAGRHAALAFDPKETPLSGVLALLRKPARWR